MCENTEEQQEPVINCQLLIAHYSVINFSLLQRIIFVQFDEFAKYAEKIKEKNTPKGYIFIDAKTIHLKEVTVCFPEKLP